MLAAMRTIWDSLVAGVDNVSKVKRYGSVDEAKVKRDLLFVWVQVPGIVDIISEYAQEFTGTKICSFGCDHDVNDIVALPKNRLVVCDDLTVRILDLQRHREQILFSNDVHPFTSFTSTIALAVLDDERLAVGENTGDIHIWNFKTGAHLRAIVGHTGAASALAAMSADRLVSASDDTTVRVWVVSTGECIQTLRGHTDLVVCVVVLNDDMVASGSWDETIRIWDIATGECRFVCEGHTEWVGTLVLIKQNVIASGSGDSVVRIWDLVTGGCMMLEGHTDAVSKLVVLKDGTLVSGSADKTLRAWDSTTGKQKHKLAVHTDGVHSMAMLTNGNLVSASNDLIVWQ